MWTMLRAKGSRGENNFTDARPTSRIKVYAWLVYSTRSMQDKLQGEPADRAAEKSIIDPSVSASHSTRRLRNPASNIRRVPPRSRNSKTMQHAFASRIPFLLVQGASNRGKGERKVERIACHRENDASVFHDVHRAIVSLPEKRELYASSGVEHGWKIALHIPNFETFFPIFFSKDSRRKCVNDMWKCENSKSMKFWRIKR